MEENEQREQTKQEQEKNSELRELVAAEDAAEFSDPPEDLDEDDATAAQPLEAAAQPPEAAAQPLKGPHIGAWLAAVLVMFLGLAAIIPAAWNALLTRPALQGLVMEAGKRYESAAVAYNTLLELERTASAWQQENFNFGSTDSPGFTTGTFVYERFALLIDSASGLLQAREFMTNSYPPDTREPRSVQKLRARLTAVDDVVALATAEVDQTAEQPDLVAALETARKKDKDAQAHALIYDALKLLQLAQTDAKSDETETLLAALQKNPESEPWMYESVALDRAIKAEDYKTVLSICDQRLARNKEDSMALTYKLKALALTGKTKEAETLAAKAEKRDVMHDAIALTHVELLYRAKKYDEATQLCNAILAANKEAANNAVVLEATLQKSITLLLSGKAKEALQLMQTGEEIFYTEPSMNYAYGLLAVALAAGDEEYFNNKEQEFTGMGLPANEKLTALQAGKTTVEKIFTEGWGGFGA